MAAPPRPSRLFADTLHPNDRGYDVIAEQFFRAITTPRGTGTRP
jgi:hypothetical protein